jgi:isoleucyl-tRNA synthetase
VKWIPTWGRDRIYNMVQARPDWCLSRQRVWGVPIPSIRSKTEGKSILDLRLMDKFTQVVAEKGTDAWFTEPLEAFWPEGFVYEPTGESRPEQFEKEWDILDVWFDSGSTSVAVCEQRPGLKFPASLYLEGSDQHRGWFQSSLLIGIGARERAPYEAVLTHGFVLDAKGEAMSKSKGNVISPQEIVKQMGADGLRLWVISEDYRCDVTISKDILTRVGEAYRRIRNTLRFLIGNLYDFDPDVHAVPVEQLEECDRWNLSLLNELVGMVRTMYENFEFHRIYQLVHNFCSVQLSARYLDVIKDRLYCAAPGDPTRRAAQTTCHILLDTLVRMVAPVLVFTADEVWEYGKLASEAEPSVHMASFPEVDPAWNAPELDEKWASLLDLRSEVSRILEDARREKLIGHSLEASVEITAQDGADHEFLLKNLALLENLFIVSEVQLVSPSEKAASGTRAVRVEKAAGRKCERCWMVKPQVGANAEHGGLCPRCVDVVGRMR